MSKIVIIQGKVIGVNTLRFRRGGRTGTIFLNGSASW